MGYDGRDVATRDASEPEIDDAALVERWRAGDRRACKVLFDRYYPAIARFFRNKVRSGGDDLVQVCFLRCFEGIVRLQEAVAFRSFLFGIACNLLREHYRRGRGDAERVDLERRSVRELAGEGGPWPSAGAWLAAREEHRLLLEALRRIPLEHQILVELFYWEGMRVREIAEVVGAPEGTIKTRLRRGRALLEEALAELAATPAILTSTLTDLDRWADEIRAQLALAGVAKSQDAG
ncbi:MAG: sigma-70 family RNA polymerase sigma factor [Myxococcales bacterium]|nr:sigma-70 family RNA polymerase sigma factor [Myxococcales bacterium]